MHLAGNVGFQVTRKERRRHKFPDAYSASPLAILGRGGSMQQDNNSYRSVVSPHDSSVVSSCGPRARQPAETLCGILTAHTHHLDAGPPRPGLPFLMTKKARGRSPSSIWGCPFACHTHPTLLSSCPTQCHTWSHPQSISSKNWGSWGAVWGC